MTLEEFYLEAKSKFKIPVKPKPKTQVVVSDPYGHFKDEVLPKGIIKCYRNGQWTYMFTTEDGRLVEMDDMYSLNEFWD